jgi:hypothetical protein
MRQQHRQFVEVSALAAARTDRRAGTELVLRLLCLADDHQHTVLIRARDEVLVNRYRRIGFRPALPAGSRSLCRPAPQTARSGR